MKEKEPFEAGEAKEASFGRKKQAYFTRLGLKMRQALELHKASGLWERKDGKRDWGNVSEHCLAEAARVGVLAGETGLSDGIRGDLIMAAALHDVSKKEEILSARKAEAEGTSVVAELYRTEGAGKEEKLTIAGFSKRVAHLAEAAGGYPETQLEVKRILDQGESMSEEDLAYLIMHYVDAYTRDSGWVESSGPDGQNDLDRRTLKTNRKYENWEKIIIAERVPNEPLFTAGLSEAMRQAGHRIEALLAQRIESKTGRKIDPETLPEFVDGKIKDEINDMELGA